MYGGSCRFGRVELPVLTLLRADVRWGVGIGLRMAVIYAVFGGLITAFSSVPPEQTFLLIVTYFVGGLGSGFLLGLLRNWVMKSRRWAMLLGPVIAVPAMTAVGVFTVNIPNDDLTADRTNNDLVIMIIFMSLVFGLYGGWYFGPSGPGYSAIRRRNER